MNEAVSHHIKVIGNACTHEEHSVDVVDITVLPTSVMDVFARHADLGAVENSRLGRV